MSVIWLFAAAAALPDNALEPPPKQIQALVDGYGECIAKRERKAAEAAILNDASDEELARDYPQLAQGNCVPMKLGDYVQIRFTPTQMRNVIAEMLVRRELANVPPPVLDEVPGLSHRSPGDPATTDSDGRPLAGHKAELALAAYERDRAAAYLSRFGECVVRVNPAGSKALLMTDEGTAAEAAAFSALSTALGTCVAEGRTLNFDKWTLKGSIAVNYYRLAMAARNAPSSTAAR